MALVTNAAYDHYVINKDAAQTAEKSLPDTGEYGGAKLGKWKNRDSTATTTNIDSWPFSWKQMLRFAGFKFNSGGTFKVCYCEASMVSTGRCGKEADFKIQVGTVHASGVSCLFDNALFRRYNCHSQLFGGDRCYKNNNSPGTAKGTPTAWAAPTFRASDLAGFKTRLQTQIKDLTLANDWNTWYATATALEKSWELNKAHPAPKPPAAPSTPTTPTPSTPSSPTPGR